MKERIIYKSSADKIKFATKSEDGRWAIFVGSRGGDLRRYKTLAAMDKEMKKRGYTREEKNE